MHSNFNYQWESGVMQFLFVHQDQAQAKEEYRTGNRVECDIVKRTVVALTTGSLGAEEEQAILTLLSHSLEYSEFCDNYSTHKQSPLCLLKHSLPYRMSQISDPLHRSDSTAGSDSSLYLLSMIISTKTHGPLLPESIYYNRKDKASSAIVHFQHQLQNTNNWEARTVVPALLVCHQHM